MSISTTKLTRYKVAVEGNIIQQKIKFKYMGIEILGYEDVEAEIRNQKMTAARTAACLNSTNIYELKAKPEFIRLK